MFSTLSVVTLLFLAQSDAPADATAAAEIERLRAEKQSRLKPERLPWLHRTILYVRQNKIPEKITYGYKGLRPRFGTLGPGSGFGLGAEYFRADLDDERMTVRTSLTASPQKFWMIDGEFERRRVGGKAFVNFLGFHRFAPRIDFYGVGSRSSFDNLTAYSLEENVAQFAAGWQATRRVRAGGLTRYFTANVGATRNRNLVSTEQVFSGAEAPGLGDEPPYFETGAFIEVIPNPELGAPPGGNRGWARWSYLRSQRAGAASFARLDAMAERTQMFLNQQRAVLVRARVVLSAPKDGGAVPFYLQPQLGGQDELRGFAGRRFYDNNMMAATLEYQWQIFSGVSLALFADAGKVFPRWDRWSVAGMEKSYGGGVRFGAGRFDIGYGREGAQFWIVFATF